MKYFIDAAAQIIAEEGIEGVTIRKVADLAGYNVATVYNYFSNLEHLIFFAAMRFTREYVCSLPDYIKTTSNALEKYLRIWECFCHYSFSKPLIYHAIFFTKLNNSLADSMQEYYQLYPQELKQQPEELLPMLLQQNIYERTKTILAACATEGFISWEALPEINEMTLLIYQGMLSRIINKQVNYTLDEAVKRTMQYIKRIILAYQAI